MDDDQQSVVDRSLKKLKKVFRKVGREATKQILILYFSFNDSPTWAKAVIAGALGYFLLPLDSVPDFLAPFGYTDDILMIAAALKTIDEHITDEVREKAANTAESWFGEEKD